MSALARMPTGSGSWDTGSGTTLTLPRKLTVEDTLTETGGTFAITTAAGTGRSILFQTAGVNRWILQTDGTAETGSNAGSNLSIQRRADDGSSISTLLSANRATGAGVWGGAWQVTGNVLLQADLAHVGTKAGVYGNAAVNRPAAYTQNYTNTSRTVNAYTADPETSAYTGAADGEAKLADLNALRVAYENLRASHDNLMSVFTQVLDDLQLIGWLQ